MGVINCYKAVDNELSMLNDSLIMSLFIYVKMRSIKNSLFAIIKNDMIAYI